MAELLLEILSEEIPETMQKNAADAIARAFKSKCESLWPQNHSKIDVQSFGTPRRLSLYATNVPSVMKLEKIEIRGPRIGADAKALSGFMGKYGINDISEMETREDFYFFETKHASNEEEMRNVLQTSLQDIIYKFKWPQSMIWSSPALRWVRPIRSLLCLFDGKILPLNVENLIASDITYGHRFMYNSPIKIKSGDDYFSKLKQAKVVLSLDERKKMILSGLDRCIQKQGLHTSQSLHLISDNALLEEVGSLIEYPFVLLGSIDKRFMTLPKEVLLTTLKTHQKYLMLQDETGNLAPYFVIVANIIPNDEGITIIEGNARVVEARLADALFFVQEDKKTSLAEKTQQLHKITFHVKLGDMFIKVQRIRDIAQNIADQLHLKEKEKETLLRAALMSKADLITNVVREFPELQGIMGYHYALSSGEGNAVAEAIRDQYKPVGPHDAIPQTLIGCLLAISDKLDTLQQMFSIGLKPNGSKDPYALRRAALGIIRMLCTNHESQYDNCLNQLSLKNLGISTDVLSFIGERVKYLAAPDLDISCDAIRELGTLGS